MPRVKDRTLVAQNDRAVALLSWPGPGRRSFHVLPVGSRLSIRFVDADRKSKTLCKGITLRNRSRAVLVRQQYDPDPPAVIAIGYCLTIAPPRFEADLVVFVTASFPIFVARFPKP